MDYICMSSIPDFFGQEAGTLMKVNQTAKSKIQATQRWLTRAEENFEQNSPVRGQMDLLLAEAELRSTRESVASHPDGLAKIWGSQRVALMVAFVLAIAGMGGSWWWLQTSATELQTAAPIVSPVAPIPSSVTHSISAAPVQRTEIVRTVVVEATNSVQEVKSADKPADKEPSTSQEEMKRLIQTAGQALRGRSK